MLLHACAASGWPTIVSNAAFAGPIALCVRHRRQCAWQGAWLSAAALFSVVYHLCHEGVACLFPYEAAARWDYLTATASIWVVLLFTLDVSTRRFRRWAVYAFLLAQIFVLWGPVARIPRVGEALSFALVNAVLGTPVAAAWVVSRPWRRRPLPWNPRHLARAAALGVVAFGVWGFQQWAQTVVPCAYVPLHTFWHVFVAVAVYFALLAHVHAPRPKRPPARAPPSVLALRLL